MYRRILVASDFSAPATAGARLGASLAAPDAALLAVHVVPTTTAASFAAPAVGIDPVPAMGWAQASRAFPLTAEEEERTRAQLHAWLGETGLRDIDGVVTRGEITRGILAEAENHAADLVVMGARGHTRLEEAIVGSTAREVIRHAKADVLLAEDKAGAAYPPRRIAVATSLDEASRTAARRALQIADATGATLLLLHAIGPGVQTGASYGMTPAVPPVVEDSEWLENGVAARLEAFNREELGGRATVLRARGHLAHELSRLAHEGDADLLVMGHHHAGFLERLLLGSVAEQVARHPPCSTLFVQE